MAFDAKRQTKVVHRNRVRAFMGRQGKQLSDDQLDTVVNSYQGRQIIDMLRYTAEGTGKRELTESVFGLHLPVKHDATAMQIGRRPLLAA